MKAETIAKQIIHINTVINAFALSKQVEGQTAKERVASELLQDARSNLLEELQAREEKKPALS